jgi:hypothetical protein
LKTPPECLRISADIVAKAIYTGKKRQKPEPLTR